MGVNFLSRGAKEGHTNDTIVVLSKLKHENKTKKTSSKSIKHVALESQQLNRIVPVKF